MERARGDRGAPPDGGKSPRSAGGTAARPEIVFGLVGAVGTDLNRLSAALQSILSDYNYTSDVIRLSELLREVPRWANLPQEPLDEQISTHQKAGDELRTTTKIGGALAVFGVQKIRRIREMKTGLADDPLFNHAFIIRSLKHPDEVAGLQRIYGPSFYLIAGYSPIETRRRALAREIARSKNSAREDDFLDVAQRLIRTDEAEAGLPFGQNVRNTYPLADVFVDVNKPERLAEQLGRFTEIVFGHPFHTPTRDESAMFHAQAAAARSADLARQVGAVIEANDGEVVAVGTNDVPKFGGGLYWPNDPDSARDFELGRNESLEMRRMMLGEVLDRLSRANWLNKDRAGETTEDGLVTEIVQLMDDTLLMSVGEFGRTVHAEMALLDAARRGVAVRGHTLFSTTFPCHNCTKHIVASGIARVVYIYPYPKSLAARLHRDSIVVDPDGHTERRVNYEPFVGIAPRKYMDFFTMRPWAREEPDGAVKAFSRSNARPRFIEPGEITYPASEDLELVTLRTQLGAVGLADVAELKKIFGAA